MSKNRKLKQKKLEVINNKEKQEEVKTKPKKRIFKDFIFRDNKQITVAFTVAASILILTFSLLFVFVENPTLQTISSMGNSSAKRRVMFITWGIVCAVFLGLVMIRMFNTYKYTSKKARNMVRLSYLFLIGCVFLPSMYEFPFLAHLHDICGISFAICTIFSIFFFLMYLKSVNKKIGNVSLMFYFAALFFPLLTFFIFGHCGVYEIVFFVSIAIFLIVFEFYLRKHKNSLFPSMQQEEEITKEVLEELKADAVSFGKRYSTKQNLEVKNEENATSENVQEETNENVNTEEHVEERMKK